MWNKIAELAKDASYKRLGIALIVSALVHAWMFGDLDLSLPVFKKEMHVIEARIQVPKTKIIQALPQKKVSGVTVSNAEKPVKVPSDNVEIFHEQIETVPLSASTEPIPELTPSVNSEPEEIEPNPELQEQVLKLNPNAYHYIETDFDVRTKIDGPVEGVGKITYDLNDNNQYKLTSILEAGGLAALFIPDLLQTSEGLLTEFGLQPQTYFYKLGGLSNKTRKADFDWPEKTLHLSTDKGNKTETLSEGTQDLLSFMYQFMYVEPLQNMRLIITNGKKLGIYEYSFEGEEVINSSLGEIKTIHIVRGGYIDDEKTELWLATEYQYIPVKIRKTEKDGKLYEMLATKIVTTRPTIDSSQQVK